MSVGNNKALASIFSNAVQQTNGKLMLVRGWGA